jgi:hypothetical protein
MFDYNENFSTRTETITLERVAGRENYFIRE